MATTAAFSAFRPRWGGRTTVLVPACVSCWGLGGKDLLAEELHSSRFVFLGTLSMGEDARDQRQGRDDEKQIVSEHGGATCERCSGVRTDPQIAGSRATTRATRTTARNPGAERM